MEESGDQRAETSAGADSAEGDDPTAFKPRRTGVIVLALLALALCGGVLAFFLTRETREPLRVLVAVDAEGQWWEGSTSAARLLDNVVPHLRKLGFDVIDGGDLEIVKKLEGAATPEEAAQRVGASFIVTGPIKVEITDLGKDVGMFAVRASGTIHLGHADGGKKALGWVRTWSGAPEKPEALKLASQALGWQTFDALLPGLMAHEAVQAIANGGDAIAAGKLTAAKVYLEKRASQLDFARQSYGELVQRFKTSDRSPNKITLHTTLTRQDGLCALGASGFFAKSNAIRTFYSPETQALGYFEELEQLYWQGADARPRPVFEGYNVAGYASASPDGTTAAYVEDLYGAGTTLNVLSGVEASKRIFMDPKVKLSEPKVAPGGKLAAVWARGCPRCPAAVLVVDLKSGKELYRSDPKLETLGGFTWLGPARLGVLVRSASGDGEQPQAEDEDPIPPSQRLQAVDLTAAPPGVTVLGSVSGEAKLTLPTASADGSRVVFSRYADDAMHLALYDSKTERLEPLAVERAHEPSLAPGGDKIVFMRGGDIAVYDIATQQTQALTETGDDFSLRYPQFSLDGKSVYFEVRVKDPVFPKQRSLSAVASVPVP